MDPKLHRDINRLSTEDLVLCWGMVERLYQSALARGDKEMADEFSARLRALNHELASRQGRLFDEVSALRQRNADAG